MRTLARLSIFAAALALVCATSLSATPITLVPDSGWQVFGWTKSVVGSTTPIDTPLDGYTLTAIQPTALRILDCCSAGDMFQVDITGMPSIWSSTVPYVHTGALAYDPSEAWANPAFSRLELLLNPGTYNIKIAVSQVSSYTGAFQTEGNGWIQADSGIPEPATYALLALGFLGLGALKLHWRKS